MFESFRDGLRAAVIGSTGGIGGAFVRHLEQDARVASILATSRSPREGGGKVCTIVLDTADEAGIERAAEKAGALDLVIVATGILSDGDALRPEKSWRQLDPQAMSRVLAVNTIGPALIAKHFLGKLAKDKKSVFASLSARVGSIEDNRLGGWHAYRASKAALNQLIRTLSIELRVRNPGAVICGLHPGTVDTALSRPFQNNVPEERLFTAEKSTARMLAVLDHLGPEQSGGLYAYDGTRIPF